MNKAVEAIHQSDQQKGNSTDSDDWIKDSTWIYLSKTGDTIKKEKHKDNIQIK